MKREILEVLATKVSYIVEELKKDRQIQKKVLLGYKEELLEVAEKLDSIYNTDMHTSTVKKDFYMYKQLRTAVAASTLRLEFYLLGYTNNFKEEVLKDGIYYTVKQGRVDSEDEVVAVEEGKIVWKDGHFREEYGLATSEELKKVIDEVKALQEEIQSTTDEVVKS